jgi:hypothetical protein
LQRRRWTALAVRAVVLLAAAILLAEPATASASAGWLIESKCCCPSPAQCRCPGGRQGKGQHDGGHDRLRACGNSGHVATPVQQILLQPPRFVSLLTLPVRAQRPTEPAEILSQTIVEIETPPF